MGSGGCGSEKAYVLCDRLIGVVYGSNERRAGIDAKIILFDRLVMKFSFKLYYLFKHKY